MDILKINEKLNSITCLIFGWGMVFAGSCMAMGMVLDVLQFNIGIFLQSLGIIAILLLPTLRAFIYLLYFVRVGLYFFGVLCGFSLFAIILIITHHLF